MGLTASRPQLGWSICPLCASPDAEVLSGTTGTAFMRCGECTARLRVSSRKGDRLLRSRTYMMRAHPAAVRIAESAESVPLDEDEMPAMGGAASSDRRGPKQARARGSSRQ